MAVNLPVVTGDSIVALPPPSEPFPYSGGFEEEMPNILFVDDVEIGLSDFGTTLVANGPTAEFIEPSERQIVRDVLATYYRGAGVLVDSQGACFDVTVHHCHNGAKVLTSDSEVSRSRFLDCRDACMFIAGAGGSANVQEVNNHKYGGRFATYNEGSSSYRSVNNTEADSFVGYMGDFKHSGSHQAAITNALFQHNTVRDVIFTCTGNHLMNCIVNCGKDTNERYWLTIPGVIDISTHGAGNAKVAVEMASRCSIRGGCVELYDYIHDAHTPSGNPCECIWIMPNTNAIVIDTHLIEWQGYDGAVGIRTKGKIEGLRVDVMTDGFHQTNSRLLIVDNPTQSHGLDITLRVNNPIIKPGQITMIGGYVNIATGWTGTIRFIDNTNSASANNITLTSGQTA